MARMGEDAYYIRKSIEHFLTDFPNQLFPAIPLILLPHAPNVKENFPPAQSCLLLNSRQASGFFCTPDFTVRGS